MKFIDLTDPTLGSSGTFTHLDVLTLEAYMLNPNDETARNEVRTATAIEFANRHSHLLPDDFFREIFQTTFKATPLENIQTSSRPKFNKGFITGIMLHHALWSSLDTTMIDEDEFEASLPPKGSVDQSSPTRQKATRKTSSPKRNPRPKNRSLDYAVKMLSEMFGPGYSTSNINSSIWPKYRPVSHYWAAYISEGFEGHKAFPCSVDRLPCFLAKAEFFRMLGEANRTWKSPDSILSPGECIRLPCNSPLPQLPVQPEFFCLF